MLLLLACTGAPDGPKHTDTPPVDTDTGFTDTDTGVPTPNRAPTTPVIVIAPASPAPGADLTAVLVTASTDPDGDVVSYRYAWTVDGAGSSVATETVPGALTVLNQIWGVTVTPTDGTLDGAPATATVTVGNEAPSAPGLSFLPAEPAEGDDISLVLDPPSVDPDGDPVTTTIDWYQDGILVTWFANLTTISGAYVEFDETFRAVVTVTDGFHDPVVTEASVSIVYTCDNLPDSILDDTTLSEARAYHGIAFDDDGTLIGYDARSALIKSRYDETRSVFVPGVGTIQQIDRLPDGDFVAADNSAARLIRITSAGGTETLATGVGSTYGVTVGPDGMVYIANGNVLRVDPDTAEVTTLFTSGSGWIAHTINFNLDSTVMYIGVIGVGSIYYVELDSNLDPVTSPAVYATGVGAGYHDGLGVDVCGNLWVADYSSSGLYRVETDGTVTSMVTPNSTAYGHGVAFGNGIDGWRDDTIYQPQPYNSYTVREIVIGFGNGDTVRTWNGVAAPW